MTLLLTLLLLSIVLLIVDSFVVFYLIRVKQIEKLDPPLWCNIPGGLTYWFLLHDRTPR